MIYRFGRVGVDIISNHPAGYFLEDEMHPLGARSGIPGGGSPGRQVGEVGKVGKAGQQGKG